MSACFSVRYVLRVAFLSAEFFMQQDLTLSSVWIKNAERNSIACGMKPTLQTLAIEQEMHSVYIEDRSSVKISVLAMISIIIEYVLKESSRLHVLSNENFSMTGIDVSIDHTAFFGN